MDRLLAQENQISRTTPCNFLAESHRKDLLAFFGVKSRNTILFLIYNAIDFLEKNHLKKRYKNDGGSVKNF
jgi:hypothetical protein